MRVPFIPTASSCAICSRHVEGAADGFICGDCKGRSRPHFDRAACAVRFEGKARDMLLDYKFEKRIYLKSDFADWLEGAARARFDTEAVDAVAYMPISPEHARLRGYNQCEFLARELAMRLDRKLLRGALRRIGHPRRQSGLGEEERRENAKGTFAAADGRYLRGRTILLVDDIMATGATLSESARSLKEAGAWRVWCIAVARSVR